MVAVDAGAYDGEFGRSTWRWSEAGPFVRSPGGLGDMRRRLHVSCAATPPSAAVTWSTGPGRRSGTRADVPSARERRARCQRPLLRYFQNGTPWRSQQGAARGSAANGWTGRRHGRRQYRHCRGRGVHSRSPSLNVSFQKEVSMLLSHAAMHQALYIEGRGALRRELNQCPCSRRLPRVRRARTRRPGMKFITPEANDQQAAIGCRGACRARSLGGRYDSRTWKFCYRNARGTHDPHYDVASPSSNGDTGPTGRW